MTNHAQQKQDLKDDELVQAILAGSLYRLNMTRPLNWPNGSKNEKNSEPREICCPKFRRWFRSKETVGVGPGPCTLYL